jgi:hypothetical protein
LVLGLTRHGSTPPIEVIAPLSSCYPNSHIKTTFLCFACDVHMFDVCLRVWECDALRSDLWCRRDSARPHKQVLQPVVVRRNQRQVVRTSRLGVFSGSPEMEGEESSADTATTGDYSPGETKRLLVFRDVGSVWDFCLGCSGF